MMNPVAKTIITNRPMSPILSFLFIKSFKINHDEKCVRAQFMCVVAALPWFGVPFRGSPLKGGICERE